MKNFFESLEAGENILFILLIGAAIYGIYYFSKNGFCNLLGSSFPGCDNPCSGGAGAICTDVSGNYQTNPESYTDALSTTLSSPIATIKSILGF